MIEKLGIVANWSAKPDKFARGAGENTIAFFQMPQAASALGLVPSEKFRFTLLPFATAACRRPMKIHHLTAAEALESLGSSMNGLDDAMIEGRLREFGFNRIEETRKPPALLLLPGVSAFLR